MDGRVFLRKKSSWWCCFGGEGRDYCVGTVVKAFLLVGLLGQGLVI